MANVILYFPRKFVDEPENIELLYHFLRTTCISQYSGGSVVAIKECHWWLDYIKVPYYFIDSVIEELYIWGIPAEIQVRINLTTMDLLSVEEQKKLNY